MINQKKKTGSYYTPSQLVEFVVGCLNDELSAKNVSILEPSCGDGVFLNSLKDYSGEIDAVEINKHELEKSREIENCTLYNSDFLDFFGKYENSKKYDLIIGNPPYIKSKFLSEEQVLKCEKIHEIAGLSDKKLKNIWTAFLVASTLLLKPKGAIAFILPAEILQVNFASEIRELLKEKFNHIEVYTFSELFFGQGGQDTILLVCKNKDKKKRQEVLFAHVESVSTDLSPKLKYHDSCSNGNKDKWTNSVLSEEELNLIDKFKSLTKPIKYYCDSRAGIVTGANNFFILDKESVGRFGLQEFVLPIVQKSYFTNNPIIFSKQDFKKIEEAGKPCYLLNITEKTELNNDLKEYLKEGKNTVGKGYKCRIREVWHEVPSKWTSEAFFFKRSHIIPKFTKNEGSEFYVTDSAYRVVMRDEFKEEINSLIFSFYNSFTLALAELEGRFYGGGVLELTPNEFKSLHVPFLKGVLDSELELFSEHADSLTHEELIKRNDKKILSDFLGFSANEVFAIQGIRKKLLMRRRIK